MATVETRFARHSRASRQMWREMSEEKKKEAAEAKKFTDSLFKEDNGAHPFGILPEYHEEPLTNVRAIEMTIAQYEGMVGI